MFQKYRGCISWVVACILGQFLATCLTALAQSGTAATELHIGGDVPTPLILTIADLKKCLGRRFRL